MNVEHGTFTSLEFFVSGSFDKEYSMFYKHGRKDR